ncbi:MAG: trypsin-like peptidase domain-containing protein, partial [Gemmatimonadetes bacterium]|nr:trypsin-like peptidase domain-containing protein [Gemmatimonadota bacterium]
AGGSPRAAGGGGRGPRVGARILAGLGAWVMLVAPGGCGPDTRGEEARPVLSWEAAADSVRRSVHSVWASRLTGDSSASAFGPVGTAFAVDRRGLVLSNAHVVTGGDGRPLSRLHVLVQGEDGNRVYPAEAVAVDVRRDLALLRIGDTTLVPVRWSEDRASMGAPLATIGYGLPEGGVVDTTGGSITTRFTVFPRFVAGYSSGYRTLEAGDPSTNVLELDLALFPGVSGGPVFRPDGGVVGVNWRQIRVRSDPTPFGTAIPVLVVRQFLDAVRDSAGIPAIPPLPAGSSDGDLDP